MLFHSLDYVLFLALVVVLFWSLVRHDKSRLVLLLLASCRFYMLWHPAYILLLLASVFVAWFVGKRIPEAATPRARKGWLLASLAWSLGILGTFKYFNFFASVVTDSLGLLGLEVSAPALRVILPVGVSFFTFQSMAYTIDVYRGSQKPESSLLHVAAWLVFFPTLLAGPIVRAGQLLPQFHAPPRLTPRMAGEGLFLILKGLVKKVVVADFLVVNLVDRAFDNPAAFTSLEMLVALYAYTMQIYCDFSGYTDVARGSAMLLGLELPENFARPYKATSPAEFWRRWHITLSRWLREYVYYPLGGSHVGTARTYFNLWLTLFLIGCWHGAGWTFVVYGIVHGTAMVIHRYFYKRSGRTKTTVDPRWLVVVKIFLTFHFVVLSRILFRSDSLGKAGDVVEVLMKGTTSLAQVSWGLWAVLGVTFLIHWLPQGLVDGAKGLFVRLPAPVQGLVMAGVTVVMVKMAATQAVPYVYFQF